MQQLPVPFLWYNPCFMHYKCLFPFSLSSPLLLVTHVGFQLNEYYPRYIVVWNSLDYKLPELQG